MIVWPVVVLVGFLALTAFVIAMGTRSTARYEQEQRGAVSASPAPAEAVGVPVSA